jgi:predicted NUDIX family NTP pyrophosphohydrolase
MSKTPKQSAGLLMYRRSGDALEVFLVHPGGPYFSKMNEGSWTLPKGEYEVGEEPLAAAQREFQEETGFDANEPFMELGTIKQKSGKLVLAWGFEGDCDPTSLVSNTCEIEWPPRSKKRIMIPEVDRGAWFSLENGRIYIREEQRPFLERLRQQLAENGK